MFTVNVVPLNIKFYYFTASLKLEIFFIIIIIIVFVRIIDIIYCDGILKS